jgi:hypothetical protein
MAVVDIGGVVGLWLLGVEQFSEGGLRTGRKVRASTFARSLWSGLN